MTGSFSHQDSDLNRLLSKCQVKALTKWGKKEYLASLNSSAVSDMTLRAFQRLTFLPVLHQPVFCCVSQNSWGLLHMQGLPGDLSVEVGSISKYASSDQTFI